MRNVDRITDELDWTVEFYSKRALSSELFKV